MSDAPVVTSGATSYDLVQEGGKKFYVARGHTTVEGAFTWQVKADKANRTFYLQQDGSKTKAWTLPDLGGAAPPAALAGPTYRARVETFYRTYNPAKIDDVTSLLSMYEGREEELIAGLVKKYGAEPALDNSSVASSATGAGERSHKQRMIDFYVHYGMADKVPTVDKWLDDYKGREAQLFAALVKKYGAEPPYPPPATAAPTVTSAEPMSPSTARPPAGSKTYKERVEALYKAYKPDKLSKAAAQLEQWAGQEEALIQQLVSKFGAEPTDAASAEPMSPAPKTKAKSYLERVEALYKAYKPDKAAKAAGQVQQWAGQEEALIQQLVTKYGPEPADAPAEQPKSPADAAAEPASPAPVSKPSKTYAERCTRRTNRTSSARPRRNSSSGPGKKKRSSSSSWANGAPSRPTGQPRRHLKHQRRQPHARTRPWRRRPKPPSRPRHRAMPLSRRRQSGTRRHRSGSKPHRRRRPRTPGTTPLRPTRAPRPLAAPPSTSGLRPPARARRTGTRSSLSSAPAPRR